MSIRYLSLCKCSLVACSLNTSCQFQTEYGINTISTRLDINKVYTFQMDCKYCSVCECSERDFSYCTNSHSLARVFFAYSVLIKDKEIAMSHVHAESKIPAATTTATKMSTTTMKNAPKYKLQTENKI